MHLYSREQGESGHISELNISRGIANHLNIPTLRCMSRIFRTNLKTRPACAFELGVGMPKPGFQVLCEYSPKTTYMRPRFNRNSIASSDGNHVHLLHDRRANTTGRRVKQAFVRCGQRLIAVTAMQAKTLAPCQLVYKL